MEFKDFRKLVAQISAGKHLPDAVYLHVSALSAVPTALFDSVFRIADALKIKDDDWNVAKFNKRDFKVSFLSYPEFETYPYPALVRSFTIDLSKLTMRESDYRTSSNPPILHRRELLIDNDHPGMETFQAFTREGEDLGLYENARSIGFRKNWERLIKSKGHYLDDEGHLIALHDRELPPDDRELEIERHKTAIDRNQLSQPMQILARHGYLDGQWSVLDYGCGKGDDVRELEAHGLDVIGWDPNYRPDVDLQTSEITNLGFVLNVIENREERDAALLRAWELTEKLLVVSVMVAGEATISQYESYRDGVVTKLKTFQKYYAQSEIKHYLEATLGQPSIAVAQGVFFVFRKPVEEQEFLLERQHARKSWQYKTNRSSLTKTAEISARVIDDNLELFRDFWMTSLDLGRVPANSEFDHSEQLRKLSKSHNAAHRKLCTYFDADEYESAAALRRDDLLVYFALGLFSKRRPYRHMPQSLQRDVKAFFGSHQTAIDEATDLLFSVSSTNVIHEACIQAHASLGSGLFEPGHSYTFHKDKLPFVGTVLRVFVGCALTLYGELNDADLIKAHITSGKVTFLEYDDWSKEESVLLQRVKVRLRDQDIDYFDHSSTPQLLDNKLIYL